MKKFEILEHTADLKIKAWGKDLPEVFVNLAKGVASQQVDDLKQETSHQSWEEIKVESPDLSSLLIDWLNEILYQGEINQKVYLDFQVLEFSSGRQNLFWKSKTSFGVRAKIRGLSVQTKNIEIKAATYHDLEVKKVNDYWQAVVVFDI